ncbi:hypothetical protein ACHAWF_006682 [Thalassiosira exigua]
MAASSSSPSRRRPGRDCSIFPTSPWWLERRRGQRAADRVQSALGSSLMALSSLAIGFILQGPSPLSLPWLTCSSFFLGSGTGITFVHLSTVMSAIFESNGVNAQRLAMTQVSFYFGLGGVVFTIFGELLWIPAQLNPFFIMSGVYGCVGILRVIFLVREDARVDIGSPRETAVSDSLPPDDSATTQRPTDQDNAKSNSSLKMCTLFFQLIKSGMFWINSIVAGVGIGVGGSYLSSLGYLPLQFSDGGTSFGGRSTLWLTVLFLVGQTTGRLLTTLVYTRSKAPYVMAGRIALLAIGMAIVTFYREKASMTSILVPSTILVSHCYGGLWSAWFVVAAMEYPEGSQTMFNFALTFLLVFVSIYCCGLITGLNNIEHEEFDYNPFFVPFLFFFTMTLVILAFSLLMGHLITKKSDTR